MKRYDSYRGIQSRTTGIFTSVQAYGLEEIKTVDASKYKVLVECRNCRHDIKDKCQVCGVETKVR